jgi:raffinose/stachyose/melibiose transport system permease protein
MEKLLRDKKMIALFVFPALLLYACVMLYPIIQSLYIGFFQWDMLSPMKFVGLQNYITMFTEDKVFIKSITNTGVILLMSLVGEEVIGFLLAVVLTSRIRFHNLFKNLYFLPAVLSSAAVGSMWQFIYNSKGGLVNSFLRAVGLDFLAKNWLTDQKIALWAICIVIIWQYTGNTMTLFMSAILGIPASLFESARIDGASPFQVMRKITIPLIMPIIKVNTILISIGSLKFFDLVYVMTPNGGANHSTEVLASWIYIRSFKNFVVGYGNSMAVFMLFMCLMLSFIVNRIFRNTASYEY